MPLHFFVGLTVNRAGEHSSPLHNKRKILCFHANSMNCLCRGDHWSPAGLWLNNGFDICFLYGKNVGCLHKILVNATGDHWSPSGLWLNNGFDICFLYEKNVGCLNKILVNATGDHWSPLQIYGKFLAFNHKILLLN